MARRADAIAENVAGDLFVDGSCIDCDLCRQLAPAVFARSERAGQSYVAAQPADPQRALMALVTCPTSSIGSALDARAAARAFPEPVGDDVYFCGYASAASYGASSWLVRRPDGNVLVDSPRAAGPLLRRIADLGGVRWLVLTHRDDVADHAAFRARFGCERVMHRADAVAGCERVLDGDARLADDLEIVHVPGHTRGSIALLWRDHLFAGDHVWATDDQTGLEAGRDVCWYSWPEQRRSMAKLARHAFRHVLPGHGRRFTAASVAAMRVEVERLAAAM